jgi:hypothetical protein
MSERKTKNSEDVWVQWVVYNESQLGYKYSVGDWITIRDTELVRDSMTIKETESSARTKITDDIRKKADRVMKEIEEHAIVAHTIFGDIPVNMFLDQLGNLIIAPIRRTPKYLLPGVDMELDELTRVYEHFKDKIAKEREELEAEEEVYFDDQDAV